MPNETQATKTIAAIRAEYWSKRVPAVKTEFRTPSESERASLLAQALNDKFNIELDEAKPFADKLQRLGYFNTGAIYNDLKKELNWPDTVKGSKARKIDSATADELLDV